MKREGNEQGGALNDRIFPNTSEVSKIPGGVGRGRGRELPCKSDGDARRKIQIKPLRETNVGVAQT